MTAGRPAPDDRSVLVVFEPGLEAVAHQFDEWPSPTPIYRSTADDATYDSAGKISTQQCGAVVVIASSDDRLAHILQHLGDERAPAPSVYRYVPRFAPDGTPSLSDARRYFAADMGLFEDLGILTADELQAPPAPAIAPSPTADTPRPPSAVAAPGSVAAAGASPQARRASTPTATGHENAAPAELQLMSGRMLYTAPARLTTGQVDQAEVRIARGDVLDEILRAGLRGRHPEHIETVPTAARMTVDLSSSAPDKLQVVPLSVATQWVTRTALATWEFDLRAEGSGRHVLRLSVRSEIEIDGHASVHAPPVIERVVVVQVRRAYVARRWWDRHWKWAIATTLTAAGVFAGLWAVVFQ